MNKQIRIFKRKIGWQNCVSVCSILFLLVFTSCGARKKTTTRISVPKVVMETPKDKKVKREVAKLLKKKSSLNIRTIAYISKYAETAMYEMKKTKFLRALTWRKGFWSRAMV